MDAVSGFGGVFRSAVYWFCLNSKADWWGPNSFTDNSLPIAVVLVKIVIVSAVYHGSQEQK